MKVYKCIIIIIMIFCFITLTSCSKKNIDYTIDNWDNFYNASDFNNVRITTESYQNGNKYFITYEIQENKMHYKKVHSVTEIVYEEYCVKQSDKSVTIYKNNDGVWETNKESYYSHYYFSRYIDLESLFGNIKTELFVFDSSSNIYKAIEWFKNTDRIYYKIHTLKFENNLITEYMIDKEYEGEETYKFSDYGKVSITLPR